MKGKKYIYAHKFEGMPKLTDLQLVEVELPPVNVGGRLLINMTFEHSIRILELLRNDCHLDIGTIA